MQFVPYLKKHYRTITLASYLLPILFAVIVSLAHVVTFWEITNPASWAIFLSVAIEIAVLSSIAAARISNWAWVPFMIVTFIQIVGNVFFSYTNIDVNSALFKDWVELFDPLFNWMGWETDGNIIIHKRILATFSGAVIPLIAITFFQFFIRTVRMGDEELVNKSLIPTDPELVTNITESPVAEVPEPIQEEIEPEIITNPLDYQEPVDIETVSLPEGEFSGVIEKWKNSVSSKEPVLSQVVPQEDPSQLKLFDPDNPPIEEPAPQDRVIVYENEKKN